MATTSEVKVGLDEIASIIRAAHAVRAKISTMATNSSAELTDITTTYADLISTVQAYDSETGTDHEKAVKAEFTALATEFTALKADLDSLI